MSNGYTVSRKLSEKIIEPTSRPKSLKLINPSVSWSSATCMHGIQDVVRAQSWFSRAVWCMIIALSLGACFGQLVSMFFSFADRPWDSSVRERPTDGLSLPNVDICNFNRLRKSKLREYGMEKAAEKFIYSQIPTKYPFPQTYTEEQMTTMAGAYASFRNKSGLSFDQVLSKMGHQCTDLFVTFALGEDPKNRVSGADLCAGRAPMAKVEKYFNMEFGLCWRLIVARHYIVKNTGPTHGLFLMLNAELDEYSSYLHDVFLDEGFRMQISYDKLDPGSWISVPAGHHVWVKLRKHDYRTERHVFEVFPRGCIEREQIDFSLFISGYWQDACVKNCIFNRNFHRLHCITMGENKERNFQMCEPDHALEYARTLGFIEHRDQVSAEYLKRCEDNCKEPCDYDTITSESDIGVIPNPQQARRASEVLKQFNLNLTEEDVEKYLTIVNVFYKSMLVKETYAFEEYTIDRLLANIGGQLGLWTGISVISLVQGILYMCNRLSNHISNVLLRKRI